MATTTITRVAFTGTTVPSVVTAAMLPVVSREAAQITVREDVSHLDVAKRRNPATMSPFGPLDDAEPGRNIRWQRWVLSLETTWTLFDLPRGSVYVPCYIGACRAFSSGIVDAWTADSEHVDRARGTAPGLLALACRACNAAKSDTMTVAPTVADRIMVAGSSHWWVRVDQEGGLRGVWDARDRRVSARGVAQESVYWEG